MVKPSWEMSIMEFRNPYGTRYLVKKRVPDDLMTETKIFKSKKDAVRWLGRWINWEEESSYY